MTQQPVTLHISSTASTAKPPTKTTRGEIEVLSWSWNDKNVSKLPVRRWFGRGKANLATSKASCGTCRQGLPNLAEVALRGVHFPNVELTARKAGEGQKDF